MFDEYSPLLVQILRERRLLDNRQLSEVEEEHARTGKPIADIVIDFDYFDERKQGRISRSDFIDRPSPFFVRYDTKHTCRVARNDINAPAPAAPNPVRRRSGMGGRGFGF